MKQFTIITIALFAFCQPLIAETEPAITFETKEHFNQAVLDILSDNPELFETPKQPLTPEAELKVKQIIIDNAETYYSTRFDSLQDFTIAIIFIFGLLGAGATWLLDHLRKIRFDDLTKEITKQEARLQGHIAAKIKEALDKADKDTEKKVNDATKKLKAENDKILHKMKIDNAEAWAGALYILSDIYESSGNIELSMICKFEAVRYALITEKNKATAEEVLTQICSNLKLINANKDNKLSWNSIKDGVKEIKETCDLKDHPEITKKLDELDELATYNLLRLKQEASEEKDPDNPEQ